MRSIRQERKKNLKNYAKPFLKWAGGKGQLLNQIQDYLPPELADGKITRYIEPFLGGGAVFFFISQNYTVKEYYLYDDNEDIVLLYKVIQKDVTKLIDRLKKLQNLYNSFLYKSNERKEMYYELRKNFNAQKVNFNYVKYDVTWVDRASKIIFLNKTCFNGLYRVNLSGEFNVPHGDYKNANICDEDNLKEVHRVLQKAIIEKADFENCESYVNKETFVYFDPPYRPISKTSSFKSYSKNDFNDDEQERLARFFFKLNKMGAKLMLSNSDPKNFDPNDDFFEEHFFDFNLNRLNATRMINSNANKRGGISELLITNY